MILKDLGLEDKLLIRTLLLLKKIWISKTENQ